MIVVDTSAVVAVLFGEKGWERIEELLAAEVCVMSAATRVELGIVIEARKGSPGTQLLDELLARVGMQIVPVEGEHANEAIVCWRRFGKGRHRAGLNYGDTFAYALARRLGSALLFVGDDFAATDVIAA
jgi:ribonuclease VapC